MHRSNCGCGCSTGCNVDPCANCNTRCRTSVTLADLTDDPAYFQVLDENLCKKYTILNLIDCEGDKIPLTTPLVTCADLAASVCTSLAALPNNGPAIPGTVLVGSNCATYTVPPLSPNFTVLDTTTVDLTLAGSVLSANVVVSPDAGNILEVHPNGLYASVCDGIEGLPIGTPVSGTGNFVGEDCQTHVFTESPLVANDSSSIDFTTVAPNGHTITAMVRLDPDPGNLLIINPNGLFLDCDAVADCIAAETPITVIDTSTVDLTVSGVNNHTLSAVVRLSADPDNDLIVNPDGIFFSLCDALDDLPGPVSPAVPGTTVLVGNDCNLYTLPVGGISVLDTLTVDLTLTGTVLSADVEISAVPGNLITIRPDGLAVLAPASPVNIVAGDTTCIDVTVTESPTDNWTISAAPVISPTLGNQLTCSPNGLFVPAASPQVTCAAIQGIFTDTGDVITQGQAVLSDDCSTYLFPSFTGQDTATVDTSVTTDVNNNIIVSSDVIIAPTAVGFPANCNGIVASPTGLYAPPNSTHNSGEVTLGGSLQFAPMVQDQVTSSPLITVNITNPSACRSALLMIDMIIPGTNWISDVNFGSLQITGSHSFNLPAILTTALGIFTQWNVLGANGVQNGGPPGDRFFYFIVPPSFVGSYTVQWMVTPAIGNGFVSVGNVGARYSLHTI